MFRTAVSLLLCKKNERFYPVGSATFVFHEGRLLLVSAAHVFDDLREAGNVYLWVAEKIFSLGRIGVLLSDLEYVTDRDRKNDPVDLGVWVVPEAIFNAAQGKFKFIQRDTIEYPDTKGVEFYQAIGFPGKKNARALKKEERTDSLFHPEVMIYSGYDVTSRVVTNPRFEPSVHIAIHFQQSKNTDDGRNRVSAPFPQGISGGLVQGCFDYIPNSPGLYPTCAAGIIVERDFSSSSLVAIRFTSVYEWLDNHLEAIKQLELETREGDAQQIAAGDV